MVQFIVQRLRRTLLHEAPLVFLIAAAAFSVCMDQMKASQFSSTKHFHAKKKAGSLPTPIPVPSYFTEWRQRFLAANRQADQLGLVRGIFLGDDSSVTDQVRTEFREAGLSHLLAASGYNCWIVAVVVALGAKMALFLITPLLRAKHALLAKKHVNPLSKLAGAWIFWLWTDQSPPITRSVVMISGAFLLEAMGLSAGFGRLLFIQYLGSLIILPRLWGSASFQLTFGCLFGLVVIPRWLERYKPDGAAWKAKLWDYFVSGFSACVGTIPTTWIVFGTANFMSLTTNWFAVPPVSVLIMPLGLLQMALLAPHAPWDEAGVTKTLVVFCASLGAKTAQFLHQAIVSWLGIMPELIIHRQA